MTKLWAAQALLPQGWQADVAVEIDNGGRISAVRPGVPPEGEQHGILLPSPVNLHSHAFQRAMAGMTERRGPGGRDTFWTWRELMYRFLEHLTPEDIEAIAAFVQMEMLEAGYAGVCEFHYVHHQADGTPYANPGELSARIVSAAKKTGIGLTLLPVLYEQGGCDGRPLAGGQRRFSNDPDRFAQLAVQAGKSVMAGNPDTRLGVAPHSLRAVSRDGLSAAVALADGGPVHIHVAEQVAEVEEVEAAFGKRPVEWLLANHRVDERWCLIHATQMLPDETVALAATGAVAGLCPITESSLGDGIFDGARFVENGGRFGVGSDSNIRIALAEELRTLEYSQRLRDRARAILASPEKSTGRVLFENATAGGAQAAGRDSGRIETGMWADLVALDDAIVDLAGREGDAILDTWIFAADDSAVSDVWSAGRHVVDSGRHIDRQRITETYRATMKSLLERI